MMKQLLDWVTTSQAYFHDLGFVGFAAYAVVIMVVQFFLAPVSPLAIAAGVIFGMWGGLAAVSLGTALGVSANFLVARHLARGPITRRLGKNEKFRLIDAAIGREGWKIIALLRFCPIPFGLSNFCYGLTAIPFLPYFLASVVAITPANCFFVWLGASASAGAQQLLGGGRPRHPVEYVLLGVGIVAAFAALTYVGRIARKAIAAGEATPAS